MDIKEKISSLVLNKAMNYISGDPEINIPKLLSWIDALKIESFEPQSKALHKVLNDPDNNWYKFIMDLWRDVDNEVLKSVFQNFALRGAILGYPRQSALSEKYGCNIPMTILIDPTSACNLKCTGCWAAKYGNKLNNVAGKISDERFSKMTKQYEDEQSGLAGRIKALRTELDKESRRTIGTDMFIATVR